MRALTVFSDLMHWRWAPTVGLSVGAVSYVVFAVLLIPEQIGSSATNPGGADFPGLPASTSAFSARVGATVGDDANANDREGPLPQLPRYPDTSTAMAANPIRRGFSPPLDRPEPEPQISPPSIPDPPPIAPIPPAPLEQPVQELPPTGNIVRPLMPSDVAGAPMTPPPSVPSAPPQPFDPNMRPSPANPP